MLISLALLLLGSAKCHAQKVAYVVHKEEKDGLADRKVDHITRGIDGQFYIATAKSIQQFDGNSFKFLAETPTSYDSEQISFVHIDSLKGPSFILQDNPLDNFSICTNQLNSRSILSPISESVSSSDSVFISGNSKQLFFLARVKETLYKVYNKTGFVKDIILPSIPTKLFYDAESSTFFGEWRDKTVHAITTTEISFHRGKLEWFNDEMALFDVNGIYLWDGKGFAPKHNFAHSSNDILWAKADRKGNVMIALHINVSKVNDVYLFKTNGKVITYNEIININDNIRDVYAEDFEDRMLLGTFNGLFAVNFATPGIEKHWHMSDRSKSSFGTVILGVANGQDAVYFTKELGGLYKLQEGEYKPLIPDNELQNINGLEYNAITNQLFIISYNFNATGNLTIYDVGKGRVIRKVDLDFTPLHLSWRNSDQLFVSGTYKDADNLNQNKHGAIKLYDLSASSLVDFLVPDEIKSNAIRAVYYDNTGDLLWVGTTAGGFMVADGVAKKLNNSHIRMIKKYDGKVFMGCRSDGLFIYESEKAALIKKMSADNELTENSIISMERDLNGNYWLSSFGGISVLDPNLKILRRIYEDEGLSNMEFNTMASTRSDDGKLYFGSINGLTEITPSTVLQSHPKVKVNIDQVDSWRNGKVESVPYQNDLSFVNNLDSINFYFTQPDYYVPLQNFRPTDIKYNLNKGSSVNYRKGSIHFEGLELGKHSLSISEGNASFQFLGKPSVQFKVKPNLLPLAAVLAILGIGLFIYFVFTSQKKKSAASLQEEKEKFSKKLAEMELVALRAQMNPHFIFNALGAIQYFINTKDIAKADEYLSKFAKLMRSILESSKSKFIRIEDEIKMLELYTSLEHIRFEEKFSYAFKIDKRLEGMEFSIPSMILQPLVENAINHGLYHLDSRKGELIVEFKMLDEDTVICCIKDNGIGRKAAANFRKEKSHKSRGMQIIKERIEVLKRSNIYELTINYEDITVPTSGTEVEIIIHQNQ